MPCLAVFQKKEELGKSSWRQSNIAKAGTTHQEEGEVQMPDFFICTFKSHDSSSSSASLGNAFASLVVERQVSTEKL